MSWLDAKARLLRQLFLQAPQMLGEGEEAEVYALGPECVLRLNRENVSREFVNRRRMFYALLDRANVAFQVPAILDQGEHEGVHYTIERRIPGISLAAALLVVEGAARRRALAHYAETSTQLSKLLYPQIEVGEVLTPTPLRAATWSRYVLARAEACLASGHTRITGEVDRPERALAELERRLNGSHPVQPALVHGDYHPANVMVGEDDQITGVIDFGHLTLVGDGAMDCASAVINLTGMACVTSDDRQVALDCLRQQGLNDATVPLYQLYFAFRFLDTTRVGLFRWCVETIRSCC